MGLSAGQGPTLLEEAERASAGVGGGETPWGRLFFGVEVPWERRFRENERLIHPTHVLGTARGSPEGPTELGYDRALTSAAWRPVRQTSVEMSLHGAAGAHHTRGGEEGLPAGMTHVLGFQEGRGVGWMWGRENHSGEGL